MQIMRIVLHQFAQKIAQISNLEQVGFWLSLLPLLDWTALVPAYACAGSPKDVQTWLLGFEQEPVTCSKISSKLPKRECVSANPWIVYLRCPFPAFLNVLRL